MHEREEMKGGFSHLHSLDNIYIYMNHISYSTNVLSDPHSCLCNCLVFVLHAATAPRRANVV